MRAAEIQAAVAAGTITNPGGGLMIPVPHAKKNQTRGCRGFTVWTAMEEAQRTACTELPHGSILPVCHYLSSRQQPAMQLRQCTRTSGRRCTPHLVVSCLTAVYGYGVVLDVWRLRNTDIEDKLIHIVPRQAPLRHPLQRTKDNGLLHGPDRARRCGAAKHWCSV
jgi:hypothetical protein